MVTTMKNRLEVVVNDELTLEAGWWEAVEDPQAGPVRRVHPPEKMMHEQIIAYLMEDTLDTQTASWCSWRKQAVALTNVCLRWGSYFAVLADRQKPLYPKAHGDVYWSTSHLSDGEMGRINIEMSANLAWWVELYLESPNRYLALVNRALKLLPLTTKTVRGWPEVMMFQNIGHLIVSGQIEAAVQQMLPLKPEQAAEQAAARIFANALTHYSWRNGSGIEDLHAGRSGGYPLIRRRFRPSDERTLFKETVRHVEEGLFTLGLLAETPELWRQRAALLSHIPYLYPRDWMLTGSTCEFTLFGRESC